MNMKSHLKHKDYQTIDQLLTELLNSEEPHNREVSQFMETLKERISNIMIRNDTYCQINIKIPPFIHLNQPHGYNLENIILHYKSELEGNHSGLVISPYNSRFKLHRADNNGTILVVSDREILDCIQKRINEELRNYVSIKTNELLKNANDILRKHNEFTTKINALIKNIEDEEELKGRCGLSYCRKD